MRSAVDERVGFGDYAGTGVYTKTLIVIGAQPDCAP